MAQSPRRVTPMSGRNLDCAAVDFDLSTDQQALRAAAATLLDRMAGHDALRARVGTGSVVGTLPGAGDAATAGAVGGGTTGTGPTAPDAPHGYDAGVWAAMADQGWLAIEVPADEGGLGLGTVEVAVLCEEIGRRLVAAPFLPSVLALGAFSGVTGAGRRGDQGLARGAGGGRCGGLCRLCAGSGWGHRHPVGFGRARAPERRDAAHCIRALGRRGRGGRGWQRLRRRRAQRRAARPGPRHGPHARARHLGLRWHAGVVSRRRRHGRAPLGPRGHARQRRRCLAPPTMCCR